MTKLTLSNLEKIKRAEKMGYSTRVEYNGDILRVVYVDNVLGVGLLSDNNFLEDFPVNDLKIKGYLYVGQFFGEPEIPEGQKFRVKKTDEIMLFYSNVGKDSIALIEMRNKSETYRCDKSELEPVFD